MNHRTTQPPQMQQFVQISEVPGSSLASKLDDNWFQSLLEEPLTFIVLVWSIMIALVVFCFFITE